MIHVTLGKLIHVTEPVIVQYPLLLVESEWGPLRYCIRQKNNISLLKDGPVLIPGTCEYVGLYVLEEKSGCTWNPGAAGGWPSDGARSLDYSGSPM